MKKVLLIMILIFISNISIANGISEQNYDFRKIIWGMNPDEVKKSELNKPKIETESLLSYNVKFSDKDCLLYYQFVESKLIRANYVFPIQYDNSNDFLKDYNELRKLSKGVYGSPTFDRALFKNNQYKEDTTSWGKALATGEVIFYSMWVTERTNCILLLYRENAEIKLGIQYDNLVIKVDKQSDDSSNIFYKILSKWSS